MFKIFSNNKNPKCPIDIQQRLWMENSFLWLATQFGHNNIREKKTLEPTKDHFPIQYDGSIESLYATAAIIAHQMEININEVYFATYKQNIQELGSEFGHRIFTQVDTSDSNKNAAGLYLGKNQDGKYDIFIEESNLKDPEGLVAVIAHEFSHIKILGEKRLDFNDESLTDLTTVVFGLAARSPEESPN